MNKLIPKHLTPANPLVLQNDNTRVSQPVLSVPTTNRIDWVNEANNKIDKIIQNQPHSEIVRYPKRPKTEEDAMTIMFDPRKASKTSTTEVIGMSPVDPVGEFVVGNAALNKPLQWLGKGLLYGFGKYVPKTKLGNWSRATLINNKLNKPISQEALNKVNKIFRTSEWNEFLMTKNGYNYYRINTPRANGDEMIFLSHTTPWEEFVPKLDINVPAYAELGPKILYEFPHKTFGTLKASGAKPGAFGDVNVQRYGLQHLLYGNYASGERGLVRNMSSKNYMRAKQAGLDVDEFIIGLKKRPLVNGHYDQNPIYEDIYNGYQTQIKASDFWKAVKTKPHMTYEYTDNGILKILWNPLTKSAIKTSVIEPETDLMFTKIPNSNTSLLWGKQSLQNPQFLYPKGSGMMIHTKNTFGTGTIPNTKYLIPGAPIKNGQKGYIWFNKEKPYTLSVNGKQVQDVYVGHQSLIPGLIKVRDSNIPIGQWDGTKGFVTSSEYVTPEWVPKENLLHYVWDSKLNRYVLMID